MSSSIARATGAAAAVALTLATAPSALAAGAVFGGSTAAHEPIVLTGDRAVKKLKSAVIAVEARCDDGMFLPMTGRIVPTTAAPGFSPGPGDLLISRNGKGRFAGTVLAGADLGDSFASITTRFAGKLKARRASGTVSTDVTITDKQTDAQTMACHSGTVRWDASRAPGRVYAGSSSQDEPVVVRLDAKRRKVADMLAGWNSGACTPPAYFRYGERWSNLPLHARGFGDAWDESYDRDGGGKMSYAYQVAGKVGRRSATGTLHVALTGTDATGATTLSCDTGGVTWKAATG